MTGSFSRASATHAAATDIRYEWLQDSTYRIIIRLYLDCSGTREPLNLKLCYYSDCDTGKNTLSVPLIADPDNGSSILPVCPGRPTVCEAGRLLGFREWIYAAELTLPYQCSKWRFAYSLSARNHAVTNIVAPLIGMIYVEATLNSIEAPENSSPDFSALPVFYNCIYSPYIYDPGASDKNGDSLHFTNIATLVNVAACEKGYTGSVSAAFSGSFSLQEPFATGSTYRFNPQTGGFSFTSAMQQNALISTKVTEYRNGIEIGSMIRDVQTITLACQNPQPMAVLDTGSVSNASIRGNRLEACPGDSLIRFCVDFTITDSAGFLQPEDNSRIATPGAVITYTGMGTDSVRACFSWKPGYQDTGFKKLDFTVKDASCQPNNDIILTRTLSVPIFVHAATGITGDTAMCPGSSVSLLAVGGRDFRWSILPGGDLNSLSCTDCPDPVVNPAVTTDYVISANNPTVCNKAADTIRVTVVAPPVFSAGPDTATCINSSMKLDLNLQEVPGTRYLTSWTPSRYLDDPSGTAPVTTPEQDITYYIQVRPNGLQQCSAYDTIRIRVLRGFELKNRDVSICPGDTVSTLATGDNRYTYRWTPEQGVSDPTIRTSLITPDTTRTYTLTASYPGCRDSSKSFLINVHRAMITLDGDTLTASEGDTYTWINCSTYTVIAGAGDRRFVPDRDGDYSVVTTSLTCVDTSECVTVVLRSVSIPDSNGETREIQIYPNPTAEKVMINSETPLNQAVSRLYSATGKLVLEKGSLNGSRQELHIPPFLQPGIYFLEINESGNTLGVWKVSVR